MQNKYTGDVGDFGKYALLKHMQDVSGLSLGVVWYLADPDHTNGEHQAKDGKHIGYLGLKISDEDDQILHIKPNTDSLALRECDRDLHDKLKAIVVDGERSVQSIKARGILGKEVVFFDRCVSSPKNASPRERKDAREQWMKDALAACRT